MSDSLSTRYRSLDIWRGVACLVVVAYHAAQLVERRLEGDTAAVYAILRHGYLGVPLFFVISGYCIAAAAEAHRRSGRPGWTFIWRRARRIYPPFWASTALLVFAIVAAQACGVIGFSRPYQSLLDLAPIQWASGLLLTHTWTHHFLGEWRWFHTVTWSLCYEEQFYLICFATLLVSPGRFFRVMLGVTLLVTTVWLAAAVLGMHSKLTGSFLDFGWWQFACGVGVYWRLNCVRRKDAARRIDRVVWPAALTLLALSLTLALRPPADESFFVNPWLGVFTAVGFALLLLALRDLDGRMVGSLPGSLLAGVGTYSYSLYLTHVPVCILVYRLMYRAGCWTPTRALLCAVPAAIGASVLVGWLFHRLVERQFLNRPGDEPAGIREQTRSNTGSRPRRPVGDTNRGGEPEGALAVL